MKTLLFVDDEPRVLEGLKRQLRGMRREWQMHFAGGGLEALELLETTPVDVIVSDMMMPGMDGAELLAKVAERFPNVVRLILSGHSDRESVLRLVGPAHQYLSKPCDADELRTVITRCFSLGEMLADERLKQLTTRIRCLPSLPSIYVELTQALRQEEISMERLGEIISRDVGISSKLLQLVNSAFFGLPQKVSSPAQAAMYLGVSTLRALVLSIQVFTRFEGPVTKGLSPDRLARHAWMTGMLARRIAEFEGCEQKIIDQCFSAGLLHDVGRLVLATGLPEEYLELLARAENDGRPIWQHELETLGGSHCELGAYLLSLWGLPATVVEAVALHHTPGRLATTGFCPAVAVRAADTLTHELEAAGPDHFAQAGPFPSLEELGLLEKVEHWQESNYETPCPV